jgi:hypothetical protein
MLALRRNVAAALFDAAGKFFRLGFAEGCAMSRVSVLNHLQAAPRGHLVQQLRRQLGRWEATPSQDATVFSSGTAAIDRLLPGSGLRHGMLVEWLEGEWRSGVEEEWSRGGGQKSSHYSTTPLLHGCSSFAVTLSLFSAREACREGGELVVIDRRQTFYPLAAAAWGIDLARLIVLHPRTVRDELWAAVESLRSPAVAAVWGTIDRLDTRTFRSLQLAAQAGRTLGVLLRPGWARGQPSWADVRLGVSPWSVVRGPWDSYNGSRTTDHGRCVQVRVLRLRGGRAEGVAMVEIDDVARTVQEVEEGYRLSAISSRPKLLADSR